MPAIVGVDAGASHTVAIAARDGEILRTFSGDAANASAHGVERAADAIAGAVAGALDGETAAAIAVGAAGAGREDVAGALLAALARRFPGARIAITDDASIALRGAIRNGDGIVLIAGTGSIAYAEIGERRFRAGGFGYAIGDEGSGHAIGAAALRLLLRRFEGRVPQDPMLDALAARIPAGNARDVLSVVYGSERPIALVASFAPVVLEFANAGERSANKIVQAAALELFDLVRTACRAIEVLEPGAQRELPIALSGGLLRENSLLTYLLEMRIANEMPHLRIVKGGDPPHVAALAQARALAEA